MKRTVVTILGISDRATGTGSKSGKPYDFVKLAVQFENDFGSSDVGVCLVDGGDYDKLGLRSGDKYDAVVDQYRDKLKVELLDPVY